MAEVKLRLNLDSEEVELVVDGQVALSSGQEVLTSWVDAINDKRKPAPVAEATPPPVQLATEAVQEEVPAEPVDNQNQE
jgi:hypothetical protein